MTQIPFRTLLLFGIIHCGMAVAQQASVPVSDQDIAYIQESIESGCVTQGLKRSDPPTEVKAFCTCMSKILRANVSRGEWQQAVSKAEGGHPEAIQDLIAPQLPKFGVCTGK